jgi:hypothetical protein
MLALAIVLAAFPGVLAVGVGALAVLAGNDISSSSSAFNDFDNYGYDDGYSYPSSGASLSSDVNQFGVATQEAGFRALVVGGVVLAATLLTAMGSNVGRVITTIGLVLAIIYLLSVFGDAPPGAGHYLLVFLAPPAVAILGLFTPASNEVFRKA